MDNKSYTSIRNTILVAFVLLSSFLGIFTSTISQYFIKNFLNNEQIPQIAVNQVLVKIIAVGTGTTLLGVILVILIAIKITRPLAHSIKQLTAAMLEVDNGNWNIKVSINDNSELGIMAQTFNKMIQNLNETSVSKNYLDNILSTMRDMLIVLDSEGFIKSVNHSTIFNLGWDEADLLGKSLPVLSGDFNSCESWDLLLQGKIRQKEITLIKKDRQTIPVLFSASLMDMKNVIVCTAADISEKNKAEQVKEEMQKKLVEVSREAGMSEIATGVLHNVGNVLNSINISIGVIQSRLKNACLNDFFKVMKVVQTSGDDWVSFVKNHEQGQMFFPVLLAISEEMKKEQQEVGLEFMELEKYVENIKNIVYIQQSVAKKGGMIEKFKINETISQAININKNDLLRHEIEIIEENAQEFIVETDRLKVIQVLINLITNAKDALKGMQNKKIHVLVKKYDQMIQVIVKDNGIGINKDQINKIFLYGHTTKKEGHGFGLHNSALAAKEIGGQLEVKSEGEKRGAEFIFTFPCKHRSIQGERR